MARPRGIDYALAALIVGAGLLARVPLSAGLGESAAVLVGGAAVLASAWVGGLGPGVLAAAIFPLAELLPRLLAHAPVPGGAQDAATAVLFPAGVLLSVMIDRARRSERRLAAVVAAREAEVRGLREGERALRRQQGYLEQALAARDHLLRKRGTAWEHDRRRRREAELLAELSQQLHRILDVARMLHPIAAVAREATAADAVCLAFRESGGFRVRYAVGLRDPAPVGALWPEAGPFALVGVTGAVFRTEDLRLDGRVSSKPEEFGLPGEGGPLMVAPVHIGASVEAVIVPIRHGGRGFGRHDEDLLRRIAEMAGIAIRNAQRLAGEQSARVAAEASSRAKDEFLAMLGHELRNPLGAMASAVAGFERVGEQWSQLQEILGRQTRHLARLLDDLLDVSRLTVGKISLHRQPVDLRALVERVVEGLGHEGRLAGHEVDFAGDPAWVSGDPTRLEQVVRNLLDNALKYTPAGGRVTVRVATDEAEAVLSVQDTGIGIAPEILPHVFDLFVQQPRPLDRPEGGLGLGLTVVRRLVELHGGRVSARSGGRDRGSEFIVRLPVAPPAEAPAGDAAPPARAERPGRCRVAIVEDYADAREALEAVLTFDGHHVESASDGQAGLDLILATRPDVSFIDIGLPGVDGYEVARRARQSPGGASLFLVALTGYGQPFDRARALDAGFDDHLVKPLDPEALGRVLARATAAKRVTGVPRRPPAD